MVSDGCCGHFESMVYVVVDGGGEGVSAGWILQTTYALT